MASLVGLSRAADAQLLRRAIPKAMAQPTVQFVGLASNDVGYLVPVGNTLWLSSRQTLSRMIGDGKTQFDWITSQVRTDSTRRDESVSALAVSGSWMVVAMSHTEQTSQGTFGVGDGLYLSSDGGTSWTRYSMTDIFLDRNGMRIPGGDAQCFGLAFERGKLWATFTSEFAVMTPDFGRTWQRFRPDSTNNPQSNPFYDPVPPPTYRDDPRNAYRYRHLNYRAFDVAVLNDTLWVSSNAGINRSADGGKTWTNYDAGRDSLTGDFVPGLFADTANGIIWAATQTTDIDEEEVYERTTVNNEFFPDGNLNSLDWDLDRDGRVDRPGRNGVSWTADGGATWRRYRPADDPAVARDFRAWSFAINGDTVWAAGFTGGPDALLRSNDLGRTWQLQYLVTAAGDTSSSEQGTSDVAYVNGVLWATTVRGLARFDDDDTTWTFVLRYPQTPVLGGDTVVVRGGAETQLKTYAFPSPCAPRLGRPPVIVFALANTSDVTLDIYDAGGGHVWTIRQTGVSPGNRTIEWDGLTDGGRDVANGVYLYRIRTGDGHSGVGKIMVLN